MIKTVGRYLVKNSDSLVFVTILLTWQRLSRSPLTGRIALVLCGFYVILRLAAVARNLNALAYAASGKKTPRVFVDDPDAVLELAKQRGYESLRRFTPYLGKWMMISGSFDGIAESLNHDAIHLSLILNDRRRINLRFAMNSREQLLRLRKGQQIAAICQIQQTSFTFMPENCELVQVERYALARAS